MSSTSFYSMMSQMFESIIPPSNEHEVTSRSNNSGRTLSGKGSESDILCTSFNQDCTCIAVATMNGFRIFQCKPFAKAFECGNKDKKILCRKVSMLFATSLVALIGNNQKQSSLRNVKLYNTKNRQELCRLNFKSTVLNIKMNKSRLAVCVENKIHLFQINNMKQIHEVITYSNNNGEAFDLCCDDDNCLLAYPDKSKCGSIGILDAYNLQKRTIIEAHDSSLQIMRFNADGNYLCSASLMGTLIRIFAIPKGTHIYTFRRGTYPSTIYSISFNPSSTLLSVTSKNTSVHIFDLNKYKYNESKKISSSQHINQTADQFSKFLPPSIKNQIEHPRSIITINIKDPQCIIKCGWLNDYSLLCATKNGYFYRYHINDTLKTYKLLSEHSLKNNDCDLHKQQTTKIYKTKKEEKMNEESVENEEKIDEEIVKNDENLSEQQVDKMSTKLEESKNENVENDKAVNEESEQQSEDKPQQQQQLTVDDLFNLSDHEFENEPTPGNLP